MRKIANAAPAKQTVSKKRGSEQHSEVRRIAVVTGTRAEYGLLTSTLQALRGKSNMRLQLVVTGMHLLRKFGHTIDQIRADGWRVDAAVPMQRGDDAPGDQAYGLSRGVNGIAEYLLRAKSDVVVVLGDRIEAMAAALAGVLTGCVVAHIHGGDVAPGDFDDTLRHGITKLAHLHFPATKASAARILKMGEPRRRVFVVGAPGLDHIRGMLGEARSTRAFMGTGATPVRGGSVVVLQHPCGRSAVKEREVMATILAEIDRAGLRCMILHPNSDRGHAGILQAIAAYKRRVPSDRVMELPTTSRHAFLSALRCCDALVGNSSSGIIEAPFLGVPVVNVGARQQGRERGGRGIFDAKETAASIRRALATALRMRLNPGQRTPYGDGHAGERIAHMLATWSLDALRRPKPSM